MPAAHPLIPAPRAILVSVQHIEIERRIAALPERVWEVVSDHRGWVRWAGASEVVLRSEGDPAPNGLGAIRVMRGRGVAVEEEIIGFDPPERMAYRIAGGLPVKDYRGEIRLEPSGTGTLLVWTAEFSPRIPLTGPLLRYGLERLLARMASSLADQFES
jgi:uncharacterized protein YndB with AHSA1/START domain